MQDTSALRKLITYRNLVLLTGIAALAAGALFTRALSSGERVAFFGMLTGAAVITLITLIAARRPIVRIATAAWKKQFDTRLSALVRDEQFLAQAQSRHIGAPLVVIASLIGVAALALAFANWHAYYALIREDSLIENGSVLFWLLAAIASVITIVRNGYVRPAPGFRVWPYAALTAFYIIAGGEEISWGQRIFDVKTSDFWNSINVQQETNLHNLGSVSVFANAFLALTLLLFVLVPWMLHRNPALHNIAFAYSLPVPGRYAVATFGVTLAIWIIVGLRFGTLGMHPYNLYGWEFPTTQMDDELFELLAAYTFFVFAVMEMLRPRVRNT